MFKEYIWQWKTFSKNIRAFLLFDLCNQFSIAVYALYFPRYLLTVGFNEDFYGSLMGTASLLTALFAIIAGVTSDRIGRRKSLAIGISVSKTTYLVRAFLLTMPFLFGSFALEGIFMTLYWASTIPFIYENTDAKNRVHAYSTQGIFMRVAGITGNIVGGFLPRLILFFAPNLGDVTVFRMIFVFSLAIGVLGILQLFKIEPISKENEENVKKPATPKAGILEGIRQLPKADLIFIAKFVFCRVFVSFGAGLFLPFMNPFLIREFNASPETVGIIFSGAQFAVIIGIALAPKLSERMGMTKAIVLTRMLALPLFLVMAFVPSIFAVAAAYMLRNTLQQMSGPLQNNFLMAGLDKETRATANGMLSAAGNGARSIGLFVAGLVIVALGYSYLFLIAFVVYSISALLFFKFFVYGSGGEYAKQLQEKAVD